MSIYVLLEVSDDWTGRAFVRDLVVNPSVETNASALNVDVRLLAVSRSLDPVAVAADMDAEDK